MPGRRPTGDGRGRHAHARTQPARKEKPSFFGVNPTESSFFVGWTRTDGRTDGPKDRRTEPKEEETASQRRSSRKMRHEQRKLPRGIAAPPASAGWAVSNSCRPRRAFTQPLLEIKEAVLEMGPHSPRHHASFLQLSPSPSCLVLTFEILLRNHPAVSRHFSLLSLSLSFHAVSPDGRALQAQRCVSFE